MKRKLGVIGLITGILIVLKFWIAIYEDGEFDDKYFLIKHRPIWKTFFHSPSGMSDLKLSEMSEERQKEQLLYDEFILGISHKKNDW